MTSYRALVGPEGTAPSLWPNRDKARLAVVHGLAVAADVNPMDAAGIEQVLNHLSVAGDSFVDYFRLGGEPWTAQYGPVSTVETE